MSRARDLSNFVNPAAISVDGSFNVGINSVTPDVKLDVVGVVSATSFTGDGANITNISAEGLTGTPDITVRNVTGTGATFSGPIDLNDTTESISTTTGAVIISGGVGIAKSLHVGGNLSVGGTVTYEDITNVDSIGVITARSGVHFGTQAAGTLVVGDADGIGIGTDNPRDTLDVVGGIQAESLLTVRAPVITNDFTNLAGTGINLWTQSTVPDGDWFPALTWTGNSGAQNRSRAGITAISEAAVNVASSLIFMTRNAADGSSLTPADEKVRITSSGNVGIGTNDPIQKLHLASSGSGNVSLNITNDTTGHSAGNGAEFSLGADEQVQIWNYENTFFRIATNNDEKVRVSAGGSMGIGTNDPECLLHLEGNKSSATRAKIILADNQSGNGDFYFESAGSGSENHLVIGEGGDPMILVVGDTAGGGTGTRGFVGINSTSPTRRLDVVDSSAQTVAQFKSVGQTRVYSEYEVNGSQSVFVGAAGSDFNIEMGGTDRFMVTSTGITSVTGTLQVNGNNYPSSGSLSGRNIVINGDMRVNQREVASVTVNNTTTHYPVDQFWGFGQPSDGVYTLEQSSDVPGGFTSSIKGTVTTADASLASNQIYVLEHSIEGYSIDHLNWGTANAKSVTLSFWVKMNATGTFTGAIHNAAQNRGYGFQYSIASANTWEYKTITIPGDTTGTWNTDNQSSMRLVILGLGVGSDFDTSNANTWEANATFGVQGSDFPIETLNREFYFTGIQLEEGTVATPFEHPDYGHELERCRRYFFRGVVRGSAVQAYGYRINMRDTPGSSTTTGSGTVVLTSKDVFLIGSSAAQNVTVTLDAQI